MKVVLIGVNDGLFMGGTIMKVTLIGVDGPYTVKIPDELVSDVEGLEIYDYETESGENFIACLKDGSRVAIRPAPKKVG